MGSPRAREISAAGTRRKRRRGARKEAARRARVRTVTHDRRSVTIIDGSHHHGQGRPLREIGIRIRISGSPRGRRSPRRNRRRRPPLFFYFIFFLFLFWLIILSILIRSIFENTSPAVLFTCKSSKEFCKYNLVNNEFAETIYGCP